MIRSVSWISRILAGVFLCCQVVSAGSDMNRVLLRISQQKSESLEKEVARIARDSLKAHLMGHSLSKIQTGFPVLKQRAGVFVTLKNGDRVRGCIGNLDPRESDIAHEIARNVVAAAMGDYRYRPVTLRELPRLRYLISIVGLQKRIYSVSEISPARNGLLVEWNGRGGVLLPGEAKTTQWMVAECRRKAGIPPRVPVKMTLFETVVLEYGP